MGPENLSHLENQRDRLYRGLETAKPENVEQILNLIKHVDADIAKIIYQKN